jgi:hypothetical protein
MMPLQDISIMAIVRSGARRLSALLPAIGTTSAFIAFMAVGFAIGGTAMMTIL